LFIDPLLAFNVLLVKVAEMGDGATKRSQSQSGGYPKDLKERTPALTAQEFIGSSFTGFIHDGEISFILQQFAEKLPNFFSGTRQNLASQRCSPIHSARALSRTFVSRSEISFSFKPVKQRIESAWAKPVPVPCKFLDKPEAEHGPLGGMVKDMETD